MITEKAINEQMFQCEAFALPPLFARKSMILKGQTV